MSSSSASVGVRGHLVEALRLDLVGPDNDHAFAGERLSESPTRWYLAGFLVPRNAPEEQRAAPDADDEIDSGAQGPGDDDSPPDRAAAGRSYLPSSMGLSVLVPPAVETLDGRCVGGTITPRRCQPKTGRETTRLCWIPRPEMTRGSGQTPSRKHG